MAARFSAPVQTRCGAHPSFYTIATGTFPEVKRPGRCVDHPPHLVPTFKKQLSYDSNPHILGLRGLCYGKLYLSTQGRHHIQNLTIGDLILKRVESFTYLGSTVDNENEKWTDIHSKIMTANHAYKEHIKLFRSQFLSRSTKLTH